ncbi:DNA-3-methyladenine glycosylase 2 family protein [Hyphomonas sp. WL0036]|uniref:DNA-3-methyladenine glycosylase family protein n=1 Tax=Hyphomonas sediminis TaxID=2866160 RepID=UPI001C81411C|nr:DNA-3-methyladenine glycosylase 2 family protein [Hyphomonas sediminis]MBY9066091.1 DNA-3-methyladenine glycosylase 2 family protein [Hyphomonas sediminis]
MTAPTRRRLKTACERLALADPALARAYETIGVPDWRTGEPTYSMLGRMIAHQQLSTKAAATIWGRVETFLGEVTPEAILSASEDDLRACGLSRPKVAHLTSIAEAMVTGGLNLTRVCANDLDSARAELVAVRGIGPWTAELFLLYAVGEMDAFPTADVGLMEAHKQLGRYETRMESKAFTAHAEIWRPSRGVAAHLLWGWLNAERARDSAPSAK